MVGGTTIVLRAVGPQDIYLFGNPQITHFKAVYRRHTNFAKEYKKIVNSGGTSIDFGKTLEYLIASEGDLLGELFVSVKIKATSSSATSHTINHFGNSLLKSVESGNIVGDGKLSNILECVLLKLENISIFLL